MSNEALTWAYRQTTGKAGRKAVLVALADKADEAHSCFPSQATIAVMTEQSQRTVRAHLAELEAAGFIRRTPRKDRAGHRTSDRYTLAVSVAVGLTKRQNPPVAKAAGRTALSPANTAETQPAKSAGRDSSPPANLANPTGKSRQVTHKEPSETPTVSKPQRGARLPDDWVRSPEDVAWQHAEAIPDEFARVVTGEFKNYWLSATKNAAKINWSRAWRTWMSREWRQQGARWKREHPATTAPSFAAPPAPDWMRGGQAGAR